MGTKEEARIIPPGTEGPDWSILQVGGPARWKLPPGGWFKVTGSSVGGKGHSGRVVGLTLFTSIGRTVEGSRLWSWKRGHVFQRCILFAVCCFTDFDLHGPQLRIA